MNYKEAKNNIPWIEKYRPKTIKNLMVDTTSFNKIIHILKIKNMPNIIITGVPGIGKTSTILCIAKYLLGKYFKQGVLELNASNDRGIKAVQNIITNFCKKKINISDDVKSNYSSHKIVLLDEADNMTKKAQQLVNNLMEKYKKSTRFAFTCNNSSDIIESIQSRCIIFRYRRLGSKQIKIRLIEICKKENIIYSNNGINAIVISAQGDMRQALNNLQMTYNGFGKIYKKYVYKLCNKPSQEILTNILTFCYKNDTVNALKLLYELKNNGYSHNNIILGLQNIIKNSNELKFDEHIKIKFMRITGKTHLNISRGAESMLQLSACIAELSM